MVLQIPSTCELDNYQNTRKLVLQPLWLHDIWLRSAQTEVTLSYFKTGLGRWYLSLKAWCSACSRFVNFFASAAYNVSNLMVIVKCEILALVYVYGCI